MLKMLIIFISIQKTAFSLWQLQLEVLKYSDSSLNGLDKEKEKHFCRIFFLLWDQISENKPNILSISFIWSAYFLTFSKLSLAPDIEPTFEYINKYGFPSTGPILGIYLGPVSRVRVQVRKYEPRFPSTDFGWLNIGGTYRMSHRYWANFST